MRERCGSLTPAECEARVEEAKRLALAAGAQAHRVIPGTRSEDWLDCDQCRDCFKPASFLRPRLTAQYAAALSSADETDDAGRPFRFRFGFIASTDTHSARGGSGYKQLAREVMTDQRGPPTEEDAARIERWVLRPPEGPGPVPYEPSRLLELFDGERTASFLYPGGIVAVHAAGRERAAIWSALERREVYGTSGPRILLWFDLVNGPVGRAAMGSEVALAETPRFEVRAAGGLVQQPGCPGEARAALEPERLRSLCADECYHPGDERHPIVAIEVVRIRPQQTAAEDDRTADRGSVAAPAMRAGSGRLRRALPGRRVRRRSARHGLLRAGAPGGDALPSTARTCAPSSTPTGRPQSVRPCTGGYKTPSSDNCLAPVSERAWSSPIYVDFAGEERPLQALSPR